MGKILSYVDKYNIDIKISEQISIDVLMCVMLLLTIIFFISFIVNKSKQKKVKNYTGKAAGTFVSAEAYEAKNNKKIKKALIRYTINDDAIIRRMRVPRKQLKEDTLNILYNVNNPSESILIGDNTFFKKAWINFALSIIFIASLVAYYILVK